MISLKKQIIQRIETLEILLRETHADQGGEATFADWLQAVALDENEFDHERAVELCALKYHRLAAACVPFVNLVDSTSGRIPTERLSCADWHELSKAL